jgi:hypothetical protein
MTIPLDNLYDYIFKHIKNLICHNDVQNVFYTLKSTGRTKSSWHLKSLFCYDQEPLNFSLYENNFNDKKDLFLYEYGEPNDFSIPIGQKITSMQNIAGHPRVSCSVYDKNLLLHSEINSEDLKKYEKNGFLGVYYWSHAFIALDWYRFAKYDNAIKMLPKTDFNNDFNVYCRAWTGSREYRLKFLDLLKKNEIDSVSSIFFNDYYDQTHYSDYKIEQSRWQFNKNNIDNLDNINFRNMDSSASATYNTFDYKNSAIDVVLETVFDEKKIQLTEKILRPIACGKPFILVSEKGSLEYLKSYGFKTFGSLINESYDNIKEPLKRLDSIVKTMKSISNLSQQEKNNLFLEMHKIAEYNRNWFFSENFFEIINSELKNNLKFALNELDNPKYQTAKYPRLIQRAYRRYKKYFAPSQQQYAEMIISEIPERIKLSKKNIGKY